MPIFVMQKPQIAAVVLAAGMSTRMGTNKLLAEIGGEPLVRRVVGAAEKSRARPIVVVTGQDHESIRAALAGTDTTLVYNPDFRDGMSTRRVQTEQHPVAGSHHVEAGMGRDLVSAGRNLSEWQ